MNNLKEKRINNIVIYTRVSTEMQIDGYSLDAQKENIIKYCKMHNYNIIGEYEDAGISGKNIEDRPSLKKMLQKVSMDKNIDAIVVWKLSRISRNMSDLVQILDLLKECNAGLITTADEMNSFTPMGQALFYFTGIFAQMERDNILEQSRSGMEERARQGLRNGGTPPYGYLVDKDENEGNKVDPNAAEIIKLIFELYTNRDWGYSKIVKFLNSDPDKYPTRKGKGWTYQSIQKILDNPFYNGYIRWGLYKNWNKERRKGKNDDCIIVKGKHQPIISDQMWELTQERRKQKSEIFKPVKLENMNYLLSGLAKCPQCGSSMITQRTQRKRKDGTKIWYRYYCCSQWANKKSICKPNLVSAELLEKRVIQRIIEFCNKSNLPEILNERISKDTSIKDAEVSLKNIDKKILKLMKDENKYYEYLANEEKLKILKEEKILEFIAKINGEMKELKEEREKISQQLENAKNVSFDVETISERLKNFEYYFNNANFEQQKAFIHSIVKEITIKSSEKIQERVEEAIILRINDLELLSYFEKKEEKAFEVTYDTPHLNLF